MCRRNAYGVLNRIEIRFQVQNIESNLNSILNSKKGAEENSLGK